MYRTMIALTLYLFLAGCATETSYTREGFTITANQTAYTYNSRKSREALAVIDDYMNTSLFVDFNGDQKVDKIVMNKRADYETVYWRGDVGTESLFKKADEVFQRHRDNLGVPDTMETWKRYQPTNVGGTNGMTNM